MATCNKDKCDCGKEDRDTLMSTPHTNFQHAKTTTEMVTILKAKASADSRMVGGNHYIEMAMQPWEVEEKFSTKEEFLTYLRITALDYQLRQGKKKGSSLIEDIEKAYHTLEKYIEVFKNDSD